MVTDRQTDERKDRPTLLSIELLSQLKSSLTPVFHQLPIINNYLKLEHYFTTVLLQKLVVALQPIELLS